MKSFNMISRVENAALRQKNRLLVPIRKIKKDRLAIVHTHTHTHKKEIPAAAKVVRSYIPQLNFKSE